MRPESKSPVWWVANERGVALPLALLGLISVSLLVTTALVTSSTELAISSAHRDATADLYVAEGGLQAYVATRGPSLLEDVGAPFPYQPPSGGEEEAVEVSVSYLGQQPLPANAGLLRLFSVVATPADGGRSVSTLVKQIVPPPVPLETNITSALTLGGDLDIDGNSFTVTGRSTACGSPGVEAARIASTSQIEANNDSHMRNFEGVDDDGNAVTGWSAIERTGLTRDELARDVLGGASLDDLIAHVPASHRWGPRFSPDGQPRVWDGVLDTVPRLAVDERVAVVDANGGTVEVLGGKGVVIIVNGNVEMKGSSRFDGIIITEGSFWLHGRPQVNGALISLAVDAENRIELAEEAEIDGHVTIQFDRCKVQGAQEAFTDLSRETLAPTVEGTYAWIEVTR